MTNPLNDHDITTETTNPVLADAKDADGTDADGTDAHDADGTDAAH